MLVCFFLYALLHAVSFPLVFHIALSHLFPVSSYIFLFSYCSLPFIYSVCFLCRYILKTVLNSSFPRFFFFSAISAWVWCVLCSTFDVIPQLLNLFLIKTLITYGLFYLFCVRFRILFSIMCLVFAALIFLRFPPPLCCHYNDQNLHRLVYSFLYLAQMTACFLLLIYYIITYYISY